jgi:hypothetical protein
MKSLFLKITLFLIIFSKIAFAQNESSKEWQWQNNSATPTKFFYDKNITSPFLLLKLSITNIGERKITNVLIDCNNPDIESEPLDIDETVDESGKLEINLGSYIRQAFSGNLFADLKELPEKTTISITLSTTDNESMVFDMEVSAKSRSQGLNPSNFKFIPPAFPSFTSESAETDLNNKHRILILDGTANRNANRGFQLISFRRKIFNPNFHNVRVKSLIVNRSLSIFTSNINLDSLQSVVFSLNGTEYSYNAGVSEIYGKLSIVDGEGTDPGDAEEVATGPEELKDSTKQLVTIKTYLKATNSTLSKHNYLNFIDYKRLQAYKVQLKKSIDESSVILDEEAFQNYFEIMNFQPRYINLTPFAMTVPNADEVAVESTMKFGIDEVEEKYTTGVFRTSRSLAVHVGSSLFVTGLRNNNVYTETMVIGEINEIRAKIEEKDQISVGVGVNSEISYRTGGMVRPSFNLAFFVPFAENITPFVGLGPGISFVDKNVSLNLSGGLAFGKINSIAEQYRDRDLSGILDLTNTTLTQSVWKNKWYFSIGLGFNLRSKD